MDIKAQSLEFTQYVRLRIYQVGALDLGEVDSSFRAVVHFIVGKYSEPCLVGTPPWLVSYCVTLSFVLR